MRFHATYMFEHRLLWCFGFACAKPIKWPWDIKDGTRDFNPEHLHPRQFLLVLSSSCRNAFTRRNTATRRYSKCHEQNSTNTLEHRYRLALSINVRGLLACNVLYLPLKTLQMESQYQDQDAAHSAVQNCLRVKTEMGRNCAFGFQPAA